MEAGTRREIGARAATAVCRAAEERRHGPAVASKPRSQLLALDLVRGLAALTVLLGHVRGSTWIEFGALPAAQHTPVVALFFAATRLGAEAVIVFFVLSGFLVGGQVIGRLRASTFEPRTYALDRATRILLPLIPATLLTAAVNAYLFHAPNGWPQVVANMSGLNGVVAATLNRNAPLWSLPFEIWFYVAAGAGACLVSARSSVLAVTVLGGSVVVLSQLGGPYFLFWTLGAMTTLVGGHKRHHLAILGMLLVVVGVIAIQLATTSLSFQAIQFNKHVAEAVLATGFCLCLPALSAGGVDQRLRFGLPAIRFLSAVSYSLYLFHYPINSALDLVLPKSLALSPLSLGVFGLRVVCCTVGSLVCWFAFERQTGRLRAYVNARTIRTAAALS